MGYAIEVVTNSCLIILPADLLYIYYMGYWYDPHPVIQYAELALLYMLPILGVWRIIRHLRGIKRGVK